MSRSVVFAILLALPFAIAPFTAAVEVDFAHNEDPRLERPAAIKVFPDRLKPLWLKALATDEADLQREAARAIAKAHRGGMTGLEETIPTLVELLDAPDQHSVVRRAVARTLIILEARNTAETLTRHALQGGLDMALLVEPALARWDYQPMRQVWLDRLAASDASHARRILAIDGLGQVREPQAAEPLGQIVLDTSRLADERLHAAAALARIKTDGSLEDARRLAQGKLVDRLAAARLLTEHQGADVQKFLLQMAVDPQPAVAAIALERLKQLDPMSIEPIADRLVSSEDAKVRMLTAQMLFRQRTAASVRRLGVMLADVNPDLRLFARESLIETDEDPPLRAAIRKAAMTALDGDNRHALQQAIVLVGAIDHEPAADRLVQLLDDDDPDNSVPAAWSLRKLAVPATAEAIRKKIRRGIELTNALAERNRGGAASWELPDPTLGQQVTHLLEALGRIGDRGATPLFIEFLPRPPPSGITEPPAVEVVKHDRARAAALWALAACYANEPNEQILRAVTDRFTDSLEEDKIREMAAIGLGRLKSEGSIPLLRAEFDPQDEYSHLGHACSWALQQITGEKPHVWKRRPAVQIDWFLEPLP